MLFAGSPQKPKSPPKGQAAGTGTMSGTAAATKPKPQPRTPPRQPTKPQPRTPARSAPAPAPRTSPGKVPTSTKAPTSKPTPPAPKPPSLKSYLAGDVSYQDLIRGQQRTLADFLADVGRQRGEAETSFGDVTRSMETERERALKEMMDNFASRGLLQSGLFGEAQGQYQQDWQNQMGMLEQSHQGLLGDLLSQETNFKREQELAQEAARQDAIRRRAQKYGIE